MSALAVKPEHLRVVVTGFDAFGGHAVNPSGLLAGKLGDENGIFHSQSHGKFKLENLILETCCTNSWTKLSPALESTHDDDKIVLIMMGLADNRSEFSLERVALNLRDYPFSDNQEHIYSAVRISDKEFQNAFFNNLPLEQHRDFLINRGFPCEVSHHAGTYVCNDLYFQALEWQQKNKNLALALFVHVPLPAVFCEQVRRNYALAGNEEMLEGKLTTEQAQLDYMAIGLRTLLDQLLVGLVATA